MEKGIVGSTEEPIDRLSTDYDTTSIKLGKQFSLYRDCYIHLGKFFFKIVDGGGCGLRFHA
jgi:hypothetical protein